MLQVRQHRGIVSVDNNGLLMAPYAAAGAGSLILSWHSPRAWFMTVPIWIILVSGGTLIEEILQWIWKGSCSPIPGSSTFCLIAHSTIVQEDVSVLLQSFGQGLTADLVAYLPHLFFAGAIIILGLVTATIGRRIVDRLLRDRPPELRLFVRQTMYVGVAIGVGLLTLFELGVPIADEVILLAALFLAISLGLQDVAKTLIAGLYLTVVRPFKAGDQITVGPITGRIESIHFRTTRPSTGDSREVVVPNGIILSELVAKRTKKDQPGPS